MSRASTQRAASSRSASTRREQLRAQQLAEARKKQRTMRIIYAVCAVVALSLIAVVTVVVVNDRNQKKDQAAREQAAQVDPPNALPDRSGILVNPDTATSDVPVLTVYQDYQCPACKQAEDFFGETINKLADDGKVKLEYKTLTFLDTNLRNDSSERAARAAACAATVGSYRAYHDAVFAGQPTQEGLGYTDQQLRVDFAQKAGITGDKLASFQSCYDNKHTAKWVRESNEAAMKTFLGSTPQININGANPQVAGDGGKQTDWWRVLEPTEASWVSAIDKYKNASAEPSASASS